MTNPKNHKERAHSKFSASGSERWLNCAASVELCEKAGPGADSVWSLEGTHAHEGLEKLLLLRLKKNCADYKTWLEDLRTDFDMVGYVEQAADKIFEIAAKHPDAEVIAEKRVYNTEIDEEMFGTTDAAVVEIFGQLHVFDFKYGKGHIVKAEKNTQLIQYAMGFAEQYAWAFSKVTVHILQPRAGKNWHTNWTISIKDLRTIWLYAFKKGVQRVRLGHNKPNPGSWCHWCSGKSICPAKIQISFDKAISVFEANPFDERIQNGEKES